VNIYQKLEAIYQRTKGKFTQDTRNSQAALTGVITLAVRFISIGSGLLSISITARYLGKEQFGVWLLLSTFMNWVSLADLGLTNSLTNILATALAKDDRQTAKQSVASAFFPMVGLGILLLAIALISSLFITWEGVFNLHLSPSAASDTRMAIVVAMCLFAISIPLSIPRCVYNAYQQGYTYQLWVGLGNILSLISLSIAQYYHANLAWLLGTFFGMKIVGDLFAGGYLFCVRQPWLLPKLANCNLALFRDLTKVGFQFWIAQICSILIFQTDLIIIAQLFGAVEVGTYGVFLRLFSIIDVVSSSFLLPLWPAYSDAKAKGDYQWIQKKLQSSMVTVSIWSIGAGGILTICSPILIRALVGKDLDFPPNLPVYMLLTYVLMSLGNTTAMLVNGLGELRLQSFVAPISAIANLVLSIVLGKAIGIQGVTLATAICTFIFSILLVGGNGILAMRKELINSYDSSNDI
jgi:O-antigen/teichoic acid export membrane protein